MITVPDATEPPLAVQFAEHRQQRQGSCVPPLLAVPERVVRLIGGDVGFAAPTASREGQVTDRYTKAIKQLGSKKRDVRIGGI